MRRLGFGRLALALASALGVAAACGKSAEDPGGLMLMLSEDGPLEADRLDIQVKSASGEPLLDNSYHLPDEATLPTTLAIVSNGDPTATALIRVSAWKDDAPVDVRDAIVRQIPTNRVAALRIVLSARCSAQVRVVDGKAVTQCGDGSGEQTCDPLTGDCTSSEVEAPGLGSYRPGLEDEVPTGGVGGTLGGGGGGGGGTAGAGVGAGGTSSDAGAGGENPATGGASGGGPIDQPEACVPACGETETCVRASCVDHECVPSARFCSGSALFECDTSGLGSDLIEACPSGSYCDPKTLACEVGTCAAESPACDVSGPRPATPKAPATRREAKPAAPAPRARRVSA